MLIFGKDFLTLTAVFLIFGNFATADNLLLILDENDDPYDTIDDILNHVRQELADDVAAFLKANYPDDTETWTCFDAAHDVIRRQAIPDNASNQDSPNWARSWADSRGRKPSGSLLSLNQYWMGAPEECVYIEVPSYDDYLKKALNFQPKFCRIDFAVLHKLRPTKFSIGVCLAQLCSSRSVRLIYNTIVDVLLQQNSSSVKNKAASDHPTILQQIGEFLNDSIAIQQTEFRCYTSQMKPLDGFAISAIVVFSVLGAIAVLGTFVDGLAPEESKKKWLFLTAFSITKNVSQLLHVSNAVPELMHFNGLRAISLFWVGLYHSYNRIIIFPIDNNLAYKSLYTTDFWMSVVTQAYPAVDTFFVLSGFLVSFTTLKKLKQSNVFGLWPIAFYLHRYIRIIIPMASVVFWYTTLLPYFYNGIAYFQHRDESCEKNWWVTLLFIHNFARRTQQCLDYTWYLAVDIQLYFISPIFLVAFVWSKYASFFLLAIGIAIHICTCILIAIRDGISSAYLIQTMYEIEAGQPITPWYINLYIMPWCRCAPFVIGLGLGYIIFKWTKFKVRLNKFVVWTGWLSAVAIGLSVVYGLYPLNENFWTYPRSLDLIYIGLNRVAFSFAVAWVIFACSHGYGWLVNSFLSWSPFVVLAKLGYYCYLIHVIVIQYHAAAIQRPFHLNNMEMAWNVIGNMAISYGISAVFYILIESPVGALDAIYLAPLTKKCYEKAIDCRKPAPPAIAKNTETVIVPL